jgi:hypothetical protein
MFAVDAAYSADIPVGLATDRSAARFTVACTHELLMCSHCVTVLGPPTYRVVQFAAANLLPGEAVEEAESDDSVSACNRAVKRSRVFEGEVMWDASYGGIVRISLETARYEIP